MANYFDKYKWIFDYSDTLNQSSYHYKEEWEAYRLMLFDKMYGMFGFNKNNELILTLKGLPEENIELIKASKSVTQGYYMNKEHWFSIKVEENEFSHEEIEKFIKFSYELIKEKLPKKKKELL